MIKPKKKSTCSFIPVFFTSFLKSSHIFYVLCIIVNLCLFTDKYILFFRRYRNKNNTFPNAGHSEPLKISFDSSPGCFYTAVDTKYTDKQEIHNAVSVFSPVLFVVGQHSVRSCESPQVQGIPEYCFYELTQERIEHGLMTAAIILWWSCGDVSQTDPSLPSLAYKAYQAN